MGLRARALGLALAVGCGALSGCARRPPPVEGLQGKRVVMIVPHTDFRDEELQEPKAVLEARGAAVTVASSSLAPAKGMLGTAVTPEIALDQVEAADYDAVVFVGGVGAAEYWLDLRAYAVAQEAAAEGKVLGASSRGVVTLARSGVLKLKRVTVSEPESKVVRKRGGLYTGADVQVDGTIVTARGPQAARPFGHALAEALARPPGQP